VLGGGVVLVLYGWCSVEWRHSASVRPIGSEELRCSNYVTVKVKCGVKVHFMCVVLVYSGVKVWC
jgi:hypothetical protein